MTGIEMPGMYVTNGDLHLSVDHVNQVLNLSFGKDRTTTVQLQRTDVYIVIAHLATALRFLDMDAASAKAMDAMTHDVLGRIAEERNEQ